MVARADNLAKRPGIKTGQRKSVQSAKSRHGEGSPLREFTDDDLQSAYGANGVIFQGRQYDAETQPYYFRTRYHAPVLGCFLDRNPWGCIQGRYDLYDFEKCNPLLFIEPFSVAIPVGFTAIVVFGIVIVIHEIQGHGHRIHFPNYCPPPPDPCPGMFKDFAKTYPKFVKAAREVVNDNTTLSGWPGPPKGSLEWKKLYYERAKTIKELRDLTKDLNDLSE